MIARVWRGRTPTAKADAYLAFLQRTGIADYRAYVEGASATSRAWAMATSSGVAWPASSPSAARTSAAHRS